MSKINKKLAKNTLSSIKLREIGIISKNMDDYVEIDEFLIFAKIWKFIFCFSSTFRHLSCPYNYLFDIRGDKLFF